MSEDSTDHSPIDWSEAEHPEGKQAVRNLPAWTPVYASDIWFYRGLLIVLGLVAFGSVVGFIILAMCGKEVPQGLVAVGAGAIGALAGLFTDQARH